MSVWIKCEDRMPPLDEEVLILYKDKADKLSQDNLFYGIAKRYIHKFFPSSEGWEDWSSFTEYQSFYEVVYWTPLIDMPSIDIKMGISEELEKIKANFEELANDEWNIQVGASKGLECAIDDIEDRIAELKGEADKGE